jgi:hypothetical protein
MRAVSLIEAPGLRMASAAKENERRFPRTLRDEEGDRMPRGKRSQTRRTTPVEWNAEITIRPAKGGVFDQTIADDLLKLVREAEPAIAYSPVALTIDFGVEAEYSGDAFARALELIRPAGRAIRFPFTLERVQIETLEELARRVEEPNVPELIGVSEAADLLGVTKQRISELARNDWFPPPLVDLAAGPVWAKISLEQFRGRWARKPGRPRKST